MIISFVVTERMSPSNSPIKSKRIVVSIAMKTRPIASEEWASKPNRASPANLVFFCKTMRSKAIIPEITKTDNDKSIFRTKPIVTPNKPEWARVSPK